MVDGEIAVLAEALGIEDSVIVAAVERLLYSTLLMVAVLTHTICVIGLALVRTFRYFLPVLLDLLYHFSNGTGLSPARQILIPTLLRFLVASKKNFASFRGG